MRTLGSADEKMLRAFWALEPHVHIFAIPDLDHFGWDDERLRFIGWFDDGALIGYMMLYNLSAQWSYSDERLIPEIAAQLRLNRVRYVTGDERTAWPVMNLLPRETIGRFESSVVAMLPVHRFNRATLEASPGSVRLATLEDLDRLTEVHVSAPDQFNNFDYPTRRRILHNVLSDGWRRVYVAETPDGQPAASAQSSAEGKELAVIGGVVTVPALRGRGYATAATAYLCGALLAEGKVPYLFYRRDNLPAHRVYEKIGFQLVGDAVLAQLEWAR